MKFTLVMLCEIHRSVCLLENWVLVINGLSLVPILCLLSLPIVLFALCEVKMSLSSIDYWYNERERLGALLERYEAVGDTFSWDEVYPAYKTACDEYRAAVLAHASFTGVMF